MDYKIRVKTADVLCAGTDRDVYIVLVGDKMASGVNKESPKIEMTERITGNALERNADESFTVTCEDIGRIIKIRLSKDSTDDWECDFIEVTCTGKSKSVFPVCACIDGSEERSFLVSN